MTNYYELDESVCEAVTLLWHLYIPFHNALSPAATPDALLVLLAHGGSSWVVGKWASCEG